MSKQLAKQDMTENLLKEKYQNKRIKDLKDRIGHYQSIIGETIESKEERLDFKKLFEYALIVMSKQSDLIEILEEK